MTIMAKRNESLQLAVQVKSVLALGNRARLKIQKPGKSHVRGLFAQLAENENVSQAQLRLAVKFATTFSPEELDTFQRLRTPRGQPLRISAAYQVMYVANRQQREAILRLAAENNWSSRDIKAEVKRRVGVNEKASQGGRRPRLPVTSTELAQCIDEKCSELQRWARHLMASELFGNPGKPVTLPNPLRVKLRAAANVLEALATGKPVG
jgi:hypothetical protein